MRFKISTKEKFHEVEWLETGSSEKLADELNEEMTKLLEKAPYNVVLDMQAATTLEHEIASLLVHWQTSFYENSRSFVVCCLPGSIEKYLDENHLLELMNVTPTRSEAWDVVQMEEIERELLDGFSDE
jgi:anti-anti-sigma regulatory factor